ncbi:class C sortase [Leucobacter insecticola]|uniref:Class C sortase n=1 Tax=Leucobacter insecticola TaxID=2714934 RepID=A0A6G8FIA9_9MICO|nr:class C sortase [Leucobacter insecticola]QIM15782.1 class C sortase [Leucobacter insecticola]
MPTPITGEEQVKKSNRVWLQRLPIVLLAMVGAGILLYPSISDWFATMAQQQLYGEYSQKVSEMSEAERQSYLDAASDYNEHLPNGPLRDPYVLTDDGKTVDSRESYLEYLKQLDFGDGLPMAWVEIPGINVTLPIQHGTSDDTLEWSAGHLFGSALPVGGESTHAVVAAHSGRANAKLFYALDQLEEGDVFSVEVVGERFYYETRRIEVVDTEYFGDGVRQVQGEDHVTLLTCTPVGVNSHRLLVRGDRIPAPPGSADATDIPVDKAVASAPWWIAGVSGAPTLAWVGLAAADRRLVKRRSPAHPHQTSACASHASQK